VSVAEKATIGAGRIVMKLVYVLVLLPEELEAVSVTV
jgi:hypothetical protein